MKLQQSSHRSEISLLIRTNVNTHLYRDKLHALLLFISSIYLRSMIFFYNIIVPILIWNHLANLTNRKGYFDGKSNDVIDFFF